MNRIKWDLVGLAIAGKTKHDVDDIDPDPDPIGTVCTYIMRRLGFKR